jgi:ABC-2 type transport system ATP-binding protein
VIETLEPVAAERAAPEAPRDAIVVTGMVKCYGPTVAVDGLCMTVPQGSVYGLVGPNGCGKTTAIRVLATLVKPDSGLVEISGIDVITHRRDIRARVGYLPDSFGVYDRLTVAEYLDFYGAVHRIPTAHRRQLRDELLELVDLAPVRDEPAALLSTGMKQRLGLARCLIHDPDVLLLDEPAAGLDPDARLDLQDLLTELVKLEKTIVVSSNILPELAGMCTHVGIMRAGRLIVEGPVQSVVAEFRSLPRVRVRVHEPSDLAMAMAIIDESPECDAVDREGDVAVVASFAGSDADLTRLLSRLMEAGVAITGFEREEDTLEDVFLTLSHPAASAGALEAAPAIPPADAAPAGESNS